MGKLYSLTCVALPILIEEDSKLEMIQAEDQVGAELCTWMQAFVKPCTLGWKHSLFCNEVMKGVHSGDLLYCMDTQKLLYSKTGRVDNQSSDQHHSSGLQYS